MESWEEASREGGWLRPGLATGNKAGSKENEATQGISFCETLSGAPLPAGARLKRATESKVTPS